MKKIIIKEICIILLLCIAVMLVFGIVFYEYIPISKVVPTKISYTIPENIINELETKNEEQEENVTQTTVYEITTSDLKKYEDIGIYDKGKSNPFAMPSQTNTNNTTVNNNNTITDNKDTNSNEEHLFNTVGK